MSRLNRTCDTCRFEFYSQCRRRSPETFPKSADPKWPIISVSINIPLGQITPNENTESDFCGEWEKKENLSWKEITKKND